MTIVSNEGLKAAEKLLEETNSLVSLPEICLKLRELLADPNHAREDVVNLIVHDPGLTTRVLKIVNSAYYNVPVEVKTINHALNILGEEELNNLVIVTSIVKTMKSVDSHMDIKLFWRTSVFCAMLAKNFAEKVLESDDYQEYFICGLLLNIGQLLLYYLEPELLKLVQKQSAEQNKPDYVIEYEQLGFSHTDVGYAMANKWNFPRLIADSIAQHHCYAEETGPENPVMFTASLISENMDFKSSSQLDLDELNLEGLGLLDHLGLASEELCQIINYSFEEYLHAYTAFCGG